MGNLNPETSTFHLTDVPRLRPRRRRAAPASTPNAPSAIPFVSLDVLVPTAEGLLGDHPGLCAIADALVARYRITRWRAWNAITYALVHRDEPATLKEPA